MVNNHVTEVPEQTTKARLLDGDFLKRLRRLRLMVSKRFVGGAGGARQSLRRGSSVEFADHRAYVPGDDIRRIDWNAYARLDELVLRLYVAEEDLSVTVLIDSSASMSVGKPPKFDTAKRVAAALSYVALSGGERVGVTPFSTSIARPLPPSRGLARAPRVFRYLEEMQASGETSLRRSIDAFVARRGRPGLVLLISDFLDPAGYESAIDRLLSEKHEVSLFHIVDEEELYPTLGGDLRLIDSETGDAVEVSLDARTLKAYEARVDAYLEALQRYAKRRRVGYLQVGGGEPFEESLLRYLSGASATGIRR